jgi:hypothetical protein
MEITVILRDIIIKDQETREAYTVRTVRSAQEIANQIEETENDEAVEKLLNALKDAY